MIGCTLAPFKLALLINSKHEGAGQSAIYWALTGAQELRAADDDVVIACDGAGSAAAVEMAQPSHRFHALLADVFPAVRGGCRFCAPSYRVLDTLLATERPLLDDDQGHASPGELLLDGRQIIRF